MQKIVARITGKQNATIWSRCGIVFLLHVGCFSSFQDMKEIFPSLLADILAIFGTEVKSTAVVSVSLRTSYLRNCSTCLGGLKPTGRLLHDDDDDFILRRR